MYNFFRPNRAASLALPNFSLINILDKQQNVFDTLNLTPPASVNGGRRHSSSHYFPEREMSPPKKPKPQPLPLVPPPVPKRTFQGKYRQRSRDSVINFSNSSYEQSAAAVVAATLDNKSYSQYRTEKSQFYEQKAFGSSTLDFPMSRFTDISPSSVYTKHHSLSTSSFDDIGDSDDLVLYDKKTYVDPNKSSSDSNRSQVTIDTGYMSSNETERTHATTNGSAPRSFRSRFSSEDTQCSLDSFTSAELQRTDTTDSNYSDSPFSLKKSVFTFDRRFYDRKSETQSEASDSPKYDGHITPRRLPALPARKPLNSKSSTSSSASGGSSSSNKNRNMPPTPPIRTPSLDSANKLLQNGQLFSKFQQQLNSAKCALEEKEQHDSISDITTKKDNRPPPLRKIQSVKMSQRQDSILSSDSFSLSSSPGYNSKNVMEVPLLQHGSKMSNTIAPQQTIPGDDVDNLGPMVSLGSVGIGLKGSMSSKAGKKIPPKVNIRQDSIISSDSFSQTSSPGYNSKLMETPLLASAAKLHNVKPTFKNLEEIEKESEQDGSKENAIIKSASTPASLQTIVRLSNGSNMSLQHKVSGYY